MKYIASIKGSFQVFQTLTFPDDVMEGKSITERAIFCHKVYRLWKQRVCRQYPDFKAIVRKEWKPRKSGRLKGELCPHLHLLIQDKWLEKARYEEFCRELGLIWVDCLKTVESEKAVKVALHKKSYEWLGNQKMVWAYISKYVAKVDESEGDHSKGRSWYSIGDFDIPEVEIQPLKIREYFMVRKLLRRYMKGKNRRIAKALGNPLINTFLFIQKETVRQIVDYVIQELYRNRSPDVVHLDQVRCRKDEAVPVDSAAVG